MEGVHNAGKLSKTGLKIRNLEKEYRREEQTRRYIELKNQSQIIEGIFPSMTYSSDARVKLAEDKYVHPDITVSCEKEDRKPKDGNIRSPKIVVEVLSPSTENVDRGKKFQYYINYPTLQEYILIDSKKQSVEMYSKQGEEWIRKIYGPKMNMEVSSIHLVIPIEEIYEKTILQDEF